MPVPQFVASANSLEKSIIIGALAAHREYKKLTHGSWLWHGPESFLQVYVAKQIGKETGRPVYIDMSKARIERERQPGQCQNAEDHLQSPDISVWQITNEKLHAIIEIKRANALAPIKSDTKKMECWMAQPASPATAYMLAYTEAEGCNRVTNVKNRFSNWVVGTSWIEKGRVVYDDPEEDQEAWGVLLLRFRTR